MFIEFDDRLMNTNVIKWIFKTKLGIKMIIGTASEETIHFAEEEFDSITKRDERWIELLHKLR